MLISFNCLSFAAFQTDPAFPAEHRVNRVGLPFLSGNSPDGTFLYAKHASFAKIRVNLKFYQIFAFPGRTVFMGHMGYVFVPEMV
jgi:hypothetical protein